MTFTALLIILFLALVILVLIAHILDVRAELREEREMHRRPPNWLLERKRLP